MTLGSLDSRAAIERDMRAGDGRKSVDLAVFKGDAGANEDTADVVGLQTAAVTEATLTHCQEQEGRRRAQVLP